jgi:hypothetical protein
MNRKLLQNKVSPILEKAQDILVPVADVEVSLDSMH